MATTPLAGAISVMNVPFWKSLRRQHRDRNETLQKVSVVFGGGGGGGAEQEFF